MSLSQAPSERCVRVDLHCHSDASNKAAEAALNAINCPECYSEPEEVYAQAHRRGMDFVTITDHDSIDGLLRLGARGGVFVGEEVTCWFPEDECKLHLLVWGISREDHAALQAAARDIYEVANYVERHRIAHAVAHPIYRQNDKLERWHLERLLLMFKGFECLNGAHSRLHREAFEPLLDGLGAEQIEKLSKLHRIAPRWPEPWKKARTGGSDDHGLLNIGRTWTQFPDHARSSDEILECLRRGDCSPGGESGSSAKLAHTFYSVAVRYYSRHILAPVAPPNLITSILQTIAGERQPPSSTVLARLALKQKLKQARNRLLSPLARLRRGSASAADAQHQGTGILTKVFLSSARNRLDDHDALRAALVKGLPPLGEHEEMFRFVSSINRDVSEGLAAAISKSVDDASFTNLFDAIAAILAQQFVLAPYYFAVFHQNKERHLLRQIAGRSAPTDPARLRLGLFTDTLDDVNGVGRFLRDMASAARAAGRTFVIHTCTAEPKFDVPGRRNFVPLLSRPLPYYGELRLNLPPVLEVLHWADEQQFDAIHVSTPGPMGLCGWLAAKMLRVPLLGTYHTDFPAYVNRLTGDHRVTNGATAYMRWMYGQMSSVFSRSKAYRFTLRDLGVRELDIVTLPAGVDTEKFNPLRGDAGVWREHGVNEPRRLLYCGRVSVEKDLPMLVEIFRRLCAVRRDIALVVAGDGPYRSKMTAELSGLPVYFFGYQNDEMLARFYAASDLFVFPSRTDTLGQAVMEAQACGLPALVSNEGGPKEIISDGTTGVVLPAGDADRWARTIDELLDDEPRRKHMSELAAQRCARSSLERTFEVFWEQHVRAVEQQHEQKLPSDRSLAGAAATAETSVARL